MSVHSDEDGAYDSEKFELVGMNGSSANDADGAKNIAAQIMTAQRLAKEGKIKTDLIKDKIKDDKNNK